VRLIAQSVDYSVTLHQSKPELPFLLMLHGFMGSGRVFDHLIPQIKIFSNPLTIDLVGHGDTRTPDNSSLYQTENQIHQLTSILERLRFEPMVLYGYSMGGRLALQLATAYPRFFSGLILESAHCGLSSPEQRKARVQTDQKRADQINKNQQNFLNKWASLPLFSQTPETFKTIYRDISMKQNAEQMAYSLLEFGSGVMPNICDKLSSLQMPVHLVAGSQDPSYVSRMTQMSVQIPVSHLHIVLSAGHRVHTDQPQEILTILSNAMNASNQNEQ
jgi:2-succinyl-6-hydroxy-2,4-cyclohexadiene-1-carboxylate synthase